MTATEGTLGGSKLSALVAFLSGRFFSESGKVLKNIAPQFGSFLSVGVRQAGS